MFTETAARPGRPRLAAAGRAMIDWFVVTPESDLRLDPFDLTGAARRAYGADGRLALPGPAHWPIFPFETDGLKVKAVADPVLPEPPRAGENADACGTCATPDDAFVWTDEHWRIAMPQEPMPIPGATLYPRAHLDFGDLTEELAAAMGVLLLRIHAALAGIGGVGRVHLYKWGDGGAHLHLFVVARPEGMMQLRGMYLTTWMHTLPPLPADLWNAIRRHVGAALATGRPLS